MGAAAHRRAKRAASASEEQMDEIRLQKKMRQMVNKKLRAVLGKMLPMLRKAQALNVEELFRVPLSPTVEDLDARVPLTPTFLNSEFGWNDYWGKS